MADRLRVLVLADASSFHTERYIAELRRQGCFVMLASLETGRLTYHHLKVRGPLSMLAYVLSATEVRTVIRRFRPDVINAHFVSGYGFTAALAQARRFAPVVMHAWGSDILVVPQKSIFHRRKTAYALSEADILIADSEYLMEQAETILPCRRHMVLPWGVERKNLALHKSDYRIHKPLRIIVPRYHEKLYNNFFVVHELAPLIYSGDVELTFPNFGAMVGQFKLSAMQAVGDSLKYYNRLEREDFLKLMAQHDVYISAAISDSSPASMIEAMAMGLIPIAPNIPGVQEWLTYRHGFVYSLYEEGQLRQIVSDIIASGSDYREMRETNLKRVQKQAVFEDNIGQTIAAMHELVEQRKK